MTALQGGSPWLKIGNGVWSRDCIGEEQTASYCQNIHDGHTELTVEVPFSSNIDSRDELIQRVQNAWIVCHSRLPECATEISTGTELPQTLRYATLKSDLDCAEWLRETFRVVAGQSVEDVARLTYSRRLSTKGKRSMLYLVIDPTAPTARRHALIYNVSHVVSDAFSIPAFFNTMFRHITQVPGDSQVPVSSIDYNGVVERLPIHPSHLYVAKFTPTLQEKEQAISAVLSQEALYADHISQSVVMYPRSNDNTSQHETHCLTLSYSESDSNDILSDLRSESLSITFAAAAATLLAVKSTYQKGHETGALLGMTRNARRWVKTDQSCPSASSVVFLWIPFSDHWFRGSTREAVMHLGHAIKENLQPFLQSAHHLYMPSMAFASRRAVNGMITAAAREEGGGEPAAPSAPGFSAQGALSLERRFDDNGVVIEAHDLRHTGRQIGASPWVGMFSLWGRIVLSLGFDSFYHEPDKMKKLLADVHHNLASVRKLPSHL